MSTSTTHPDSPRLERPLADRKVSGVCAAIARNQRIDVTLVRVVTVVLMAAGGLGFIAYFAGLLLIPSEGATEPLIREGVDGPERNKVIVLGILAGISVLGLGAGPFGILGFDSTPWPLIAILALATATVAVLRRPPAGQPIAAGVQATTMGSDATTAVMDPPVPTGFADPEQPTAVMSHEDPTAVMNPEDPTAVTATEPAAVPRRRGHGAVILGCTLLALAATGGTLAAAGTGVRWDIALCAGVIAVGAIMVAAAPFGGARILAPIGLLLAVLAGTAAAADLHLRGGAGDHLARPAALSVSHDTSYNLAAGRLMVDLRNVSLSPGLTTVRAEVGFGQLVVRIPSGTQVELHAHASAGDMEIFGTDANGLDVDRSRVVNPNTTGPVLRIYAHAGFGQVRVVSSAHPLPKLGDHGTITTGAAR